MTVPLPTEYRTVYRDTSPPEVIAWGFDKLPFGPGKLTITITLYDAIAGIDHDVNPTVTLTPPGGDAITATQTSYEDDVWTGTLVIPPSAPAGNCTVKITGAKDTLGNELTAQTGGEGEAGEEGSDSSGQTDVEFINTPPETDPPEESGRTGLAVTTTGSYVSPAYVLGTKPEDAADVWWRFQGQSGWKSVSSTGQVGDSWWALSVDIDRSGETKDLTQADREIEIEVTCDNAAGPSAVVSQKITWKLTEVGKGDHLIQIGEKMIVAADANICYVEDPPPPTRVQITNSQYPWPEVWHEADTAQRANPNWVHTFTAEGHWILKGSFKCFPGDEGDESTIDKTGQVIVGEEKSTTIHVMKPLAIEEVGTWSGDALPQTAEEWESIENDDASLDVANYILYKLPPSANLTDWVRYYIQRGTKADPKGAWDTTLNRRLLWWSQRLQFGSNKVAYFAEYNGLVLSHALNDDNKDKEKIVNITIDTDNDNQLTDEDDNYENLEKMPEQEVAKYPHGALVRIDDDTDKERAKLNQIEGDKEKRSALLRMMTTAAVPDKDNKDPLFLEEDDDLVRARLHIAANPKGVVTLKCSSASKDRMRPVRVWWKNGDEWNVYDFSPQTGGRDATQFDNNRGERTVELRIQGIQCGVGTLTARFRATAEDAGELDEGHTYDEALFSVFKAGLVPADGQRGTTGDRVPSTRGQYGQVHYVSPKKLRKDAPDVVLEGKAVTWDRDAKELKSIDFSKYFEWAGGLVVAGHPDKRTVSRANAGRARLVAKLKGKGTPCAAMNVWVVWAGFVDAGDKNRGQNIRIWEERGHLRTQSWWRFRFTIQPQPILHCWREDVPALRGRATVGFVGNDIQSRKLTDGAPLRWDVSRQVRIGVVQKTDLKVGDFNTSCQKLKDKVLELAGNQKKQGVAVDRPRDDAVGNDDGGRQKEGTVDNDPYSNREPEPGWGGQRRTPIGCLASRDKPTALSIRRRQTGENGDILEIHVHFREFVRLQIGDHRNWPKQEANRDPGNRRNWYRISSLQEGAWRHVIKFENIDGTWQNNGSVAEPNNNDWIKRP